MTSYGTALAETCDTCGVAKGEPCVFTWPTRVDRDFVHYRSAVIQARAARTGEVMKRPHDSRLNKAADRHWRKVQRARRKASEVTVPAPDRDRLAAARAEREFEVREYEQLRLWLSRHARILTIRQLDSREK